LSPNCCRLTAAAAAAAAAASLLLLLLPPHCCCCRYVRADPPFIGIELDISDSGREGCSVSMLTITAQPVHWQETVQVRK
jgi:hypothetical protein